MSALHDEVAAGLTHELDALWRFGLKLAGNPEDAADLVQKTCLRALEQRENYKPQGKLRSWLFSIEHRIWLNEKRSLASRGGSVHRSGNRILTAVPIMSSEPEDSSRSDNPETNILLDQVYDVVEALPEAQRMVVLLVCVEGFSYREAADVLNVPIGTVMSRLARARVAIGEQVLNHQQVSQQQRSAENKS